MLLPCPSSSNNTKTMVLKIGSDRTGRFNREPVFSPPSLLSPHAASPFLTLPLSLSLSRSHLRFSRSHSSFSRSHLRHLGLDLSLSRFLTSLSHFRRNLTSATHGLDLSSSHLSGSRSHRRLTLAISPPPLVLDLSHPLCHDPNP
uniref:Uncharacterized protein n=1 Tax=Fagus sylvatica TaxID=28930 RepID=A0A2N9J1H4_FAGSY